MKNLLKRLWKRIKAGCCIIKITITECPTTTYSINTRKVTKKEYSEFKNKIAAEWNKSLDDMKIK